MKATLDVEMAEAIVIKYGRKPLSIKGGVVR
jgi:hypothetical protein